MKNKYLLPLTGIILAIILSTVVPLVMNNEMYHALILLPLLLVLWGASKLTGKEMGFEIGKLKDYKIAVAFPVGTMLIITFLAWITGNLDLGTDYDSAAIKIIQIILATLPLAILTEEGFFRGWLQGILEKRKVKLKYTIIIVGLAFGLWHLPLFLVSPELSQNLGLIPIYIIMGSIWGMLLALIRYNTGSIMVTSVLHTLWNALEYTLMGAGGAIGFLGITNYGIFDAERGILGGIITLIVLVWLWKKTNKKLTKTKKR